MECKREIIINGLKFRVHPVYDQYAASRCGIYNNINNETILLGQPRAKWLSCQVKAVNSKKYKSMSLQQFIFECHITMAPNGMKVVHSNGIFLIID